MSEAQVADYMTTRIATVRRETPVRIALEAFESHAIHHLPVVDEECRPCGVVSDRDLLREYRKGALDPERRMDSLMTPIVARIPPDAPLATASTRLLELNINCLLVVQNDRLCGVLTSRDILRAHSEGRF